MGSPPIFVNGLATFNDVEKLRSQQETTEHMESLNNMFRVFE